jgi:hypothetical protein
MPTQNLFGVPLINPNLCSNTTTLTTMAMTVSNNGVGSVGIAEPGRGAVVAIAVPVTAITSPPVHRVSIQGVSSRGTPDGTIKGSGTAKGDFTPTVGVNIITLDSPYTPAANELLFFAVQYLSGTVGASNRSTLGARIPSQASLGTPYNSTLTAGTWATLNGSPCVTPIYADGSYGRGFAASTTITSLLPTNASNPFYFGSSLTPSLGCVSTGAVVNVRPAASGSSFVVSLFEGANPTPVATSGTINPDLTAVSIATIMPQLVPLPAYTLTAGTIYRWVVSMTSSTAFVANNYVVFPNQAALQAFFGPLLGTVGDSSANWTDDGSSTWRAFGVIPCLDNFASSGVTKGRGILSGVAL